MIRIEDRKGDEAMPAAVPKKDIDEYLRVRGIDPEKATEEQRDKAREHLEYIDSFPIVMPRPFPPHQ